MGGRAGRRYDSTVLTAVFGPFPFMPTFEMIDKYKGLLTSTYGDTTNVIIYKDRTVNVGFALGGRPEPTRKKPLAIAHKGKFMGTLNPIHNIRVLGLTNCLTCCGIGDNHFEECEKEQAQLRVCAGEEKEDPSKDGRARAPIFARIFFFFACTYA